MKKYLLLVISIIAIVIFFIVAKVGYSILSVKEIEIDENVNSEINYDIVDFEMKKINGETTKLSSFIGKPTIVNFWASWCGPCQSELPYFEEMYKKFGEDVNFLMVNLNLCEKNETDGLEFIASNGYTFPVYLDYLDEAYEGYNLISIPQTIGFNVNGEKVISHIGYVNKEKLEKYIEDIL